MVRSTAEEKGKKTPKRKLCPHGTQKYSCKECGGGRYCEHNVQKYTRKECKGSYICEHNYTEI